MIVKNLSGHGNDGTLSTDIILSDDKLGWMVNHNDPSSAGITCKNIEVKDMSITAWMYRLAHFPNIYIASADCDGTADDWVFSVDQNGYSAFWNSSIITNEGDLTVRTTEQVNNGKWIHVTITRVMQTGLILLYINGVQKADGTGHTTKSSARTNMAIGYIQDNVSHNMSGQIGRVMVYDGVISRTEIHSQFYTDMRYHLTAYDDIPLPLK